MRGDAMAVVVGESHAKTAVEFDAYFDSVVSAGFKAADVALLEGDFDTYNTLEITKNLVLPCASNASRRSELLAPRFARLMTAMRDSGFSVPDWMVHWEITPEVALHSLHLPGFIAHDLGRAITGTRKLAVLDAGVGARLKRLAMSKELKRPALGSLETLPSRRQQFCEAPAEQRQDLLVGDLDAALGHLRLLQDLRNGRSPALEEGTVTQLNSSLSCAERRQPCPYPDPSMSSELSRYGMTVPDSPGYFKLAVQARTEAWAPRIGEALSKNRRVFVSVGSLHLPDLRYQGQVYPGLLSLLARDGFRLRPLRGAEDLPPEFLTRSWWESLRWQ